MKYFTLFMLFAVVALAAGNDIQERLKKFRDPKNVDPDNVYRIASDRHQRRMEKLEEMIQDRKRKLKEHESGHRRLNNDEHELVSRQARNFQRKLTQMKKMDPEDHADMLQHEAASLYQLNSVDYLDFDATK